MRVTGVPRPRLVNDHVYDPIHFFQNDTSSDIDFYMNGAGPEHRGWLLGRSLGDIYKAHILRKRVMCACKYESEPDRH
jgi:hypothetical protein